MTRPEPSSAYVSRISREYGLYVLDNRAVPSVHDGLKTSQRIALWLLRNKRTEIKTMGLAGEMISTNLYVHGDVSAADAVSRLASPYLNNHCLVQGEGSFGSRISPGGFGAPRYTEVRRAKFAEEFLYRDLPILPMTENYDGSTRMPATFLPLIPLVLLNGVKGIATGWATTILPRSLKTLCKAVQEVLVDGRVKTTLTPEFEHYDVQVQRVVGHKNKYLITGKVTRKNTSTLVVTELPPDLTLEAFREHLIWLEEQKDIRDFTDLSSEKIKVEIKMTREALGGLSDDQLIDLLKLRSTVTENLVVIRNGSVHRYETPRELVEDWVKWRLGWYLIRYQHLLEQEQANLVYWRSLVACFLGKGQIKPLPEQLQSLTGKAQVDAAARKLIKTHRVEVHDDVVDRIIQIPIYRWTQEDLQAAEAKILDTEKAIRRYNALIKSPKKRSEVFQSEIKESTPVQARRTRKAA